MDKKKLIEKLEKDREKGAARFILIITLCIALSITAVNLITGKNEVNPASFAIYCGLGLICGIAAWFANGNYINRTKPKL